MSDRDEVRQAADRSIPAREENTSRTVDHGLADPERTRTRVRTGGGSGSTRLVGYELGEEIARGGQGVVLAARDLALRRDVAIKTLFPETMGHVPAVRRFIREARIIAKLPHPGIPPIYALGELVDGRPFLAMKLIRGRTLAAIIAAREQRPSSDSTEDLDVTAPDAPGLIQVFAQVCQAVGFAHALGIVHRDLKPANIMVGAFGEVQVMDWGLARSSGSRPEPIEPRTPDPCSVTRGGTGDTHFDDPVEFDLSRIGEAMGTPAYMPPEQARGEWATVDLRADVFSLGGILCSILTGMPPYSGTNVLEVVMRARLGDLEETYRRLDDCGADADLVGIAKWCLSANPADRPPDAGAVAALIEAFRLNVEERLRTAERDRAALLAKAREARKRATVEARMRQSLEDRTREDRRLYRIRSQTAAAILLLTFGAIGFLWWKDRSDLAGRIERLEAERHCGRPP